MAYFGSRGRGARFAVPAGADGRGHHHHHSRQGTSTTFPWGRGSAGAGERPASLAQAMASRAPEPWTIRRDAVRAAEAAAREVALRVHPTREAERRRQGVVGYLKRLLGSTFGFEVFAYGSVPLKTYLPDGDADITILANKWLNNSLIHDVRQVLELEETNRDTEFQVKDVHFIDADVKLLKCVVENIVVDVSFNQIGGVSTFCFLELMDRHVGREHLFKRSIMLIKAWCYHESRILGAYHGLLSTYALETLVLYLFNLFHKSLHGPLEALYKFLEYFSKFDWDKYGISLNGPVLLSSLPDLTLELTVAQDELLLGQEFLQTSLGKVFVTTNGRDTNFRLKFLNIIDPLKGNNNLGRSVNKASFYRIRSAFSFGAQKLGQILMLSSECIPGEICGFFANTLQRHGKGERPDLGDYSPFESLLGPENSPSEDALCLKMPCVTEELNVAQMHKTSSTYLPSDAQGLPWNKIWFMEYTSDFSTNSSCSASFSSRSSFSQQNEKKSLPPFTESDMLDLSGDLDLHLGCLRKVHYHLEYLFDELQKAIQEAWLDGVIDEDFFKAPTMSIETRPQRLTIVSTAGTEPRKLSPVHRTEDVSPQSHVEDQADVVWQQNVPLSPLSNSEGYLVSWLSVSPKSHGTGTYIPKVSHQMYKERMERTERMPERERRQSPRLADRQQYTLDQWCSGLRNEHTAFRGTTSEVTVKQKGSLQEISQDIPSAPTPDNSSKDSVEKERQINSPSSGIELPQHGQPSSPATESYRQLKAQVVENIEFGSMGPFSLGLLSAQFDEAFPPLPPSKKPTPQVHTSVAQSPEPVVTESRPQEAYQLRDDAEFPPLKAGCR